MTKNNQQLWYTRRGKEIRGPFPKKLISRYILIGRILQSDEVSLDQRHWDTVSSLPELVPEELKADLSIPENVEKLRLARLREDERRYGDRRQRRGADLEKHTHKGRSGQERRDFETPAALRHRLIKSQTNQLIRHPAIKGQYKFAIALAFIVVAVLGGAWVFSPEPLEPATDHCEQPAQPEVDWSNCRFEGLQFVAVDLRAAKLQNTSFIGAILRRANLSQAQMSYSNMLKADVSNANLTNATLVGAVMRKADLSAVNFKGSNLAYAILRDADLSNSDLSNTDLTNTILTGANITNTNFAGAKLANTVWTDNTICAPESVGRCVKK